MTFKQEFLKDKVLTNEKTIEGIGTVKEYGEPDLERLVKKLLTNEAIIHK